MYISEAGDNNDVFAMMVIVGETTSSNSLKFGALLRKRTMGDQMLAYSVLLRTLRSVLATRLRKFKLCIIPGKKESQIDLGNTTNIIYIGNVIDSGCHIDTCHCLTSVSWCENLRIVIPAKWGALFVLQTLYIFVLDHVFACGIGIDNREMSLALIYEIKKCIIPNKNIIFCKKNTAS
jgi:hypothetical protein